MPIKIEARNLNVSLNGHHILKDINLQFSGPDLFFILGANGSGKSTLLRALAGLIPFSGRIRINEKDIRSFNRKELAKTIGYVWQNPLYGFFEENVQREIIFILKNLNLPYDNANDIIKFFSIEHLLNRSPFTLSGGEAKRVSISSVIVADQPIILFDEPESEMDLAGLERILEYIVLNTRRKLIIVATHNPLIAYKLRAHISKIIYIKNGEVSSIENAESLEDNDFLASLGIVPVNWWYQ